MKYRDLEVNYLISLLSSIFSQRTPPSPVRVTDWRELFYLAEYHDITNIAYYALIGLYDEVPDAWRERFSKIFRKRVISSDAQEKESRLISEAFEESHIDYLFLRKWWLRDFYPQPDMRVIEDIEILIRAEDEKTIRSKMDQLGYYSGASDDYGTFICYRTENCRIIFYQNLFSDNHKLKPYFSKVWKQARRTGEDSYQFCLNADDFYIYLMASVCSAFADESVDARDIIDVYLYRKHFKTSLNRTYIDSILNQLELNKLVKFIEDVSDLWFGVYEGDEPRTCKDVEEYIWSKGSYGQDTVVKLLPMILDIEIWRIKDARKMRMRRTLRWLFPNADYMGASYPIVGKLQILLPFFWIVRLIRMGLYFVKLRWIRVYRALIMKYNSRWKHEDGELVPYVEKELPEEEITKKDTFRKDKPKKGFSLKGRFKKSHPENENTLPPNEDIIQEDRSSGVKNDYIEEK